MTTLINRTYIVIKHLGSGTSGQVKLALNLRSKKLVAIKAVRKSASGGAMALAVAPGRLQPCSSDGMELPAGPSGRPPSALHKGWRSLSLRRTTRVSATNVSAPHCERGGPAPHVPHCAGCAASGRHAMCRWPVSVGGRSMLMRPGPLACRMRVHGMHAPGTLHR